MTILALALLLGTVSPLVAVEKRAPELGEIKVPKIEGQWNKTEFPRFAVQNVGDLRTVVLGNGIKVSLGSDAKKLRPMFEFHENETLFEANLDQKLHTGGRAFGLMASGVDAYANSSSEGRLFAINIFFPRGSSFTSFVTAFESLFGTPGLKVPIYNSLILNALGWTDGQTQVIVQDRGDHVFVKLTDLPNCSFDSNSCQDIRFIDTRSK